MQVFKGPITGESLTGKAGIYPWESPPELMKVEDNLDFYLAKIREDEAKDDIFMMFEIGVPVDVVVDTMTTAMVMEGIHTIDVAILLNPMLEEYLKAIADAANIKYVSSFKDLSKGSIAKEERENARLNKLLNAQLNGISAEKILQDGGLALVEDVAEKLDSSSNDIELEANTKQKELPIRKGIMGKVE